jgi:hypothetical protein
MYRPLGAPNPISSDFLFATTISKFCRVRKAEKNQVPVPTIYCNLADLKAVNQDADLAFPILQTLETKNKRINLYRHCARKGLIAFSVGGGDGLVRCIQI